jgi:hypothetical protein
MGRSQCDQDCLVQHLADVYHHQLQDSMGKVLRARKQFVLWQWLY